MQLHLIYKDNLYNIAESIQNHAETHRKWDNVIEMLNNKEDENPRTKIKLSEIYKEDVISFKNIKMVICIAS